MNKGLGLAQGVWLYFLGADDRLIDRNVLANLAPRLVAGQADLIGNVSWGDTGRIYDFETDYRRLLDSNICHQAIFTKKTVLERFGGFDLRYRAHADWEMNLRIFADADLKKVYVNRVIAAYCLTGLSSAGDEVHAARRAALQKDWYAGLSHTAAATPGGGAG